MKIKKIAKSVVGQTMQELNIYSQEETVIGSYNGKPLYRRIVKSIISEVGTMSASNEVDFNIDYIDTLVSFAGQITSKWANTWSINNYFDNSNQYNTSWRINETLNSITIRFGSGFDGNCPIRLTLEYTKTTDIANIDMVNGALVVNTNNYSEEEQVIGRWINGKPLYRKTLSLDGATYMVTNTNIDLSNLNADFIDVSRFYVTYTGGGQKYERTTFSNPSDSNDQAGCFIRNKRLELRFGTVQVNCSNKWIYVDLEYTKTTD